jgi:hypothetical protein
MEGNLMKAARVRLLILVVLAMLVSAIPALAQSGIMPTGIPTYGSVALQAGFLPDPYEVAVTSGGSISARWQLGSACSGYINDVPDFNFRWSGSTEELFIGFEALSGDTTLVVRTPGGFYWCSDDVYGLDPEVMLRYPSTGIYQVWVGSYSANRYHSGTLYISEIG